VIDSCENGGILIDNSCICLNHFSGSRCEIPPDINDAYITYMQTREPELVSFELDRTAKQQQKPPKLYHVPSTTRRSTRTRLTTSRQQYDYDIEEEGDGGGENNAHFVDDHEMVIKTKAAAPRTLITLTDLPKTTSIPPIVTTKKLTAVPKTTRIPKTSTVDVVTSSEKNATAVGEGKRNETAYYEIVPIFRLSKVNSINEDSSSANSSSTKYERIYWPWLGKIQKKF
jgi:hypothetical protein